MFASRFVNLKKLALHVAGGPPAGDPLFLLHGVSRSSRDFAPLFPALVARWQVYAIDQRGHGQSGRATRYLVRDYADDLIEILETRAEFRPAVIYGHSLGALVALSVAARCPDDVRAIILEDPPGPKLLSGVEQTPFYPTF